ncbi:inhibin beta A chain-like [Littorina saxatilis]|uniref:inhibin beta A chain-like n=1 Tax=Littorina saxatilis TaxID=31220 RepID=UPI0038B5C745
MTQYQRHNAVSHQVPVTFLLLVTSAAIIVTCLGESSTPFKLLRKPHLMPIDFRPHFTHRYQVEKLKAQILRGLNLTAVPEPPTKKPPMPVRSIHNHLPVPRNNSRNHFPVLPGDIVWSEPVNMTQKQKDQLLFRVSNQKKKSPVINRVNLILRLRSKEHPKRRRRNKDRLAKTNTQKKLPDMSGGGFQNDDGKKKERRRRKNGVDKEGKKKRKKRRKQRKVKVLVQAVNEKTGKFKRVVVQRFTVDKKFRWITLPIPASLVARAAHSSNQSLVLRVRCKRCSKQRVSIDSTLPRKKSRAVQNLGTTTYISLNPHRPYLVIRTADAPLTTHTPPASPPQRSARHVTSRGSCDSQSDRCCAERVRVSFKELGWDHWVVEPEGFTTVVCRGTCQDHRSSLNNNNHNQRLASSSRVEAASSLLNQQPWTRDRQLGENQHKDWSLGRRFSSSDAASSGVSVRPGETLESGETETLEGGETEMCVPLDQSPLEMVYYTDSNTLARTVIPRLLSQSCGCLLN